MNLANIIPILMQGKGSLSLAVTDTCQKFLADIDSDTGVKTHADAKIGTADTDTTIRRISISKCISISSTLLFWILSIGQKWFGTENIPMNGNGWRPSFQKG